MTLNQIAAILADGVNRPFDEMLIERLKFSIKYYRAKFIRQDFERNGATRDVMQSFIMPLIKVDQADSCVIDIGCTVLRTESKIPKPVRIKGGLFQYVGSVNAKNEPWANTTLSEIRYTQFNKFTNNVTRFVYLNEYGYIYTTGKFKYSLWEYIPVDPSKVLDLCVNSAQCVSDDQEFPCPADMIDTIMKGILSSELRMLSIDQEIHTDDDKDKRDV